MKVDVFISYHTESSIHIVEAIVNKLEGMGLRCWYSSRDNHKNTYASAIMDALEQCKVFLLVLNQSASKSHHVLNELEIITDRLAKNESVFVVPFRVADEEISREAKFYIKRFHWIDAMTPPMQERIDELAEYIRSFLERMEEDEQSEPEYAYSRRQPASEPRAQRHRKPAEPMWTQDEEPFAAESEEHWRVQDEFDELFDLNFSEIDWEEEESTAPKKKRGTSNILMKGCFSYDQLEKLPGRFGHSLKKYDVTSIRFTDTLEDAPDDALDVSHEGDGSVLMWKDASARSYKAELIVGAEGVIDGHLACEDLFNGMDAVEQIDFGDCFSTRGATSMLRMFFDCSQLETIDLSTFDTSEVTNMAFMFHGCSSLTHLDVSGFDTSKVELMNHTFSGCYSLEQLDIRNFDFSSIHQISDPFGYHSGMNVLYDLHAVNQLNEMNREWFCESLDIEQLPKLCLLQHDCFAEENLNKLDLFAGQKRFEWRIVSVRFTDSIADAPADAVDVSHEGDGSVLLWGVPAEEDGDKVELIIGADGIVDGSIACADLFLGLCWLEKVHFGSAFNSRGATSMARMFDSCDELREVDLEALNTSNVNTMSYMLYGCEKLEVIDVSRFDTSKVQWMNHMFDGCNAVKKLDLCGFDFSNVEQMDNLFGEKAKCTVAFDPNSLQVLSKRNRERFFRSLGMPEEYWHIAEQT